MGKPMADSGAKRPAGPVGKAASRVLPAWPSVVLSMQSRIDMTVPKIIKKWISLASAFDNLLAEAQGCWREWYDIKRAGA